MYHLWKTISVFALILNVNGSVLESSDFDQEERLNISTKEVRFGYVYAGIDLIKVISQRRPVLVVYDQQQDVVGLEWILNRFHLNFIPTLTWKVSLMGSNQEVLKQEMSTLFSDMIIKSIILLCSMEESISFIELVQSTNQYFCDRFWIVFDDGEFKNSTDWIKFEYPEKIIIFVNSTADNLAKNETGLDKLDNPHVISSGPFNNSYDLITVTGDRSNGMIEIPIGNWQNGILAFDLEKVNRHWTDLKGRQLIATTVERGETQGVRKDSNGRLTGYGMIFDILNMMSIYNNFSYETIVSPDNFYGTKLDNGSWDGMMRQIINKVWLLVFLTTVIVGLCTFLIATVHNKVYGQKLENKELLSPVQCWWIIFRFLIAQPSKITPVLITGRLLMVAWGIVVIVISSSYTANLTAFLTVPKFEFLIKKLDDLTVKKNVIWMVKKSAAFISEIESPGPTLYAYLLPDLESGRGKSVSNDEEAADLILQKGYVYLQKGTTVDKIVLDDWKNTGKCRFGVANEAFFRTPASMAFPKGSFYREMVNDFIRRLQTHGITLHLYRRYYPNSEVCPLSVTANERPMSVEDYIAVYVLLLGGFAMAVIVFVIEQATPRKWK